MLLPNTKTCHRVSATLLALFWLTACAAPKGAPSSAGAPPAPSGSQPAPSSSTDAQHKSALKLIGSGDYQGARSLLEQVVKADPEAAEAWNDLSLVQARLLLWTDAVQSARRALALKPDLAYAAYNLGWAQLHTDDWAGAKAPLETAAKAQPDRPEPLAALGQWHQYNADDHQAELLYQQAAGMGYEPATQLLANLLADEAKQWEAVTAHKPTGAIVPSADIGGQMAGKKLLQEVALGGAGTAKLYADATSTSLLVVFSSGPAYRMARTLAGEPVPPQMKTIVTSQGIHVLVTGEDPRMTEGWVLVPKGAQVVEALHARMDWGITIRGDAVDLAFRKYKKGGGYAVVGSLWRYNPATGLYEQSK